MRVASLRRRIAAAVAVVLGFAGTSAGVVVNNAGFETPELADGGFTQGDVPGWILSGGGITGVFDPNNDFFPNTTGSDGDVPPPGEGDQIAFIFIGQGNSPGVLTQTTGEVIAANTTYTLSAAVGQAIESLGRPFAGYEISLLAGSTVLQSEADQLVPAPGTFETVDVSFTTGATDPSIGQPLTIWLATTTNSAAEIDETFFDSVQLTATPVPEPVTSVAAIAFAALMLRRRQKQR